MAVGDLCTVADVQAFLSLPSGQDATLLQTLVTNASAFVSTYADISFPAQTINEVRNGHGGSKLPLLQPPCTAINSLTVCGLAISPANPSVAYGYGYFFDSQFIYLRDGVFPRGVQNIIVNYQAGFSTVPSEVAQAAIEIVALKYKRRTTLDQNSKSLNGEVVSFNQKDMPQSAKTALDVYKLVFKA